MFPRRIFACRNDHRSGAPKEERHTLGAMGGRVRIRSLELTVRARTVLVLVSLSASMVLPGCRDMSSNDARHTQDGEPKVAEQWRPEEHLDDVAGAAAVLEQEAKKRWPSEFAGLWIGAGGIFISFTTDPDEKVAELRQAVPQPHELFPVGAERSLTALRALQQRIIDDRAELQSGGRPKGMPQAIVATRGIYDVGLSLKLGALTINAKELTPELERAFVDYYETDAFVFESGIGGPNT